VTGTDKPVDAARANSWASSAPIRRTMQSNRSRDTKPELTLRKALHHLGLRYRVCTRPLPDANCTIDIVFRPARVAVQLHGCFWHGCPDHYKPPRTNQAFWSEKIASNRARDLQTETALTGAGWELIVVWEHEDLEAAAVDIADRVRKRRGWPT
jgi:DNA mismatch endonuclease, patch repair protein